MVRCLCGAASCSGFLRAKSRGFQEDTYLWEDDDYRFSIENISLYDSKDDGPTTRLLKPMDTLEDSSWLNEKHNGLMDDDIVDEKIKAQEEIFAYEEARNLAKAQLGSLYDEIRLTIEELEKDSQDSVSTSVAEKWIEACCSKQKAKFDLYSIIKNISSTACGMMCM